MPPANETANAKVHTILQRLEPSLKRSDADPRPIVLMTCGVSGAGKTTLSKAVLAVHPNFIRISMDAITASRHGIYGQDYPSPAYDSYMEEADRVFRSDLGVTLGKGQRDIILDRAFYAKRDRDEFRSTVKLAGGRCVLVVLKVGKEELWTRIGERRAREVNADYARVIGKELLDRFVEGFEWPEGEGEIVIENE